jgi:hypothetical protein
MVSPEPRVAVQLDGRDALKHHPDPVVGGPVDYVAFKGGFELCSKWKLDEKLSSKWGLDRPETLVLAVMAKTATPTRGPRRAPRTQR